MKNIHLISTDKPSRLWTNNLRRRLELDEFPSQHPSNIAKHLYITNDENPKEGDWLLIIDDFETYVHEHKGDNLPTTYHKKIILTTDQDLIKDGVQAIDDEFLQWFVQNPKCESVKIEGYIYKGQYETEYKIIIPKEEPKALTKLEIAKNIAAIGIGKKEEPKQETLEDAAKIYSNYHYANREPYLKELYAANLGFIDGAKWQQERSYSEEDMIKFAEFVATYPDKNRNYKKEMLHAKSKYDGSEKTIDLLQIWLEQFKKK